MQLLCNGKYRHKQVISFALSCNILKNIHYLLLYCCFIRTDYLLKSTKPQKKTSVLFCKYFYFFCLLSKKSPQALPSKCLRSLTLLENDPFLLLFIVCYNIPNIVHLLLPGTTRWVHSGTPFWVKFYHFSVNALNRAERTRVGFWLLFSWGE